MVEARLVHLQVQELQLRLRGLTFEAIGEQLGFSRHLAYKHYQRALRLIPKAGVDELRKLEGERITDARRRIYAELAGRLDPKFPNDPTKRILPSPRRVIRLIDSLLKIGRHEALIFGLDTRPKRKGAAASTAGASVSDKELDRKLARLTEPEQTEFLRLHRKLEGQGVDLGPEYDYEVEARAAAAAAWRAANPEEGAELELRIIEFKPGHERWEQPELFSYLTSDEQGQLNDTIRKARARRAAGKRPSESEERTQPQTSTPATSNGQKQMPPPVATAPVSPPATLGFPPTPATSNGDHMPPPVATAPVGPLATPRFPPCPKCRAYVRPGEEASYTNGLLVWHKNCRPVAR